MVLETVHFPLAPWASQHLFLSDVVIVRIYCWMNSLHKTALSHRSLVGFFYMESTNKVKVNQISAVWSDTEQMVLSEEPTMHHHHQVFIFHSHCLNHCHHRSKNSRPRCSAGLKHLNPGNFRCFRVFLSMLSFWDYCVYWIWRWNWVVLQRFSGQPPT